MYSDLWLRRFYSINGLISDVKIDKPLDVEEMEEEEYD